MSGFKFKLGFGFGSGGVYKPYIDYNWTTRSPIWHSGNPLDLSGTSYTDINKSIILSGNALSISTSFTLSLLTLTRDIIEFDNLKLYLDTTSLKLDINATTHTISTLVVDTFYNVKVVVNNNNLSVKINNVEVYNATCETLNVNSIVRLINLFDGQIDSLVVYDGVLSADSYTNPNQFYNSCAKSTGELYANTIFCTDFGGTGGYVADDRNVSVGGELRNYTPVTVNNGVYDGETIVVTNNPNGFCYLASNTYVVGNFYSVNFTVENYASGTVSPYGGNTQVVSANGFYSLIVKATSMLFGFSAGGGVTTLDITSFSIKQISNIYPITNYTSTMRTNFQTETTGMQELMIERDSLGFFLGLREFPKGNGVGWADTEWVPLYTDIFQLETIIEQDNLGGTNDFGSANRLVLGTHSSVLNYLSIYVFGANKAISGFTIGKHHVVLDLKSNFFFDIWVDGILKLENQSTGTLPNTAIFELFGDYRGESGLFKVHKTPQDPIKLYNNAQGLLQ